MAFEIGDQATTIELDVAAWQPGSAIEISSPVGESVDVLQIDGESEAGDLLETKDWQKISDEVADSSGNTRLQPPTARLRHVTLTLLNGSTTTSLYYRFVRTFRIDVVGTVEVPNAAAGRVAIDVSNFSIDRFSTGGLSRPGESEGSTVRYDVQSTRVLGANWSAIPVPAISVDLINVEGSRTRDANLLLFGAILGLVGATLLEILLTTAHLVSARTQPWRSVRNRLLMTYRASTRGAMARRENVYSETR